MKGCLDLFRLYSFLEWSYLLTLGRSGGAGMRFLLLLLAFSSLTAAKDCSLSLDSIFTERGRLQKVASETGCPGRNLSFDQFALLRNSRESAYVKCLIRDVKDGRSNFGYELLFLAHACKSSDTGVCSAARTSKIKLVRAACGNKLAEDSIFSEGDLEKIIHLRTVRSWRHIDSILQDSGGGDSRCQLARMLSYYITDGDYPEVGRSMFSEWSGLSGMYSADVCRGEIYAEYFNDQIVKYGGAPSVGAWVSKCFDKVPAHFLEK